MSSYYITATQAIVNEAQLRAMFPTSLLPSPLTATALAEAGAEPILESPAPVVTATQMTSINGVVQDSSGNWIWNWVVTNMSPDQVSAAVSAAQTAQTALVSAACQAAIYAGFTSSALGTVYNYPFQDKDQTNLNGDVLLSTLPIAQVAGWTKPFWCADPSVTPPAWAMRPHTAAQIQQVGIDAAAAKLACIEKNIAFAAQIAATQDIPTIQSIKWS